MRFSFRALNGVNTCVNMWVFVPLKVCQIFEVCQSALLRDSHFVSVTDLNLESMRRVFVSFTRFIELRVFFLCGSNVRLLSSSFPRLLLLVTGLHSSSVLSLRFGTNSIFCSSDSGQESKSGPGTILLQRQGS